MAEPEKLDDRINHLEREVGQISVQLDSISDSLSLLSKRINQPTNYFAIVTVAIAVLGAMITFVNLSTNPIQATIYENAQEIRELQTLVINHQDGHPERVEDTIAALAARTDDQFESIRREIVLHKEIKQRQLDMLNERVELIDLNGSRRCISRPDE